MAVEAEVPWLKLEAVSLHLPCHGLYLGKLLDSLWLVCLYQVVEQLVDVCRICCHAAFEHIVGECLEAEQLRHLPSEVYEAFADVYVIL